MWLGVRLWRAPVLPPALEAAAAARPARAILLHAFAVTALNPKGILFFVAFVPQFVDPAAAMLLQLAVLEATFVMLAALNAAAYALLAARARGWIRAPGALRAVNRLGGAMLIGAGLLTVVAWRRAG